MSLQERIGWKEGQVEVTKRPDPEPPPSEDEEPIPSKPAPRRGR